jgi:hypothetical protein
MQNRRSKDKQNLEKRPCRIDLSESAFAFLYHGHRFSSPFEIAPNEEAAGADVSSNQTDETPDRRSQKNRRFSDRRSGADTRSEVEQFLQGERRAGGDRRTNRDRRHRSFKKARAFTRGLKLASQAEWYNYSKSDEKPQDIPVDPHIIYANDGWAGWGDWLGASPFATHLSQYRSNFLTFGRRLHAKFMAVLGKNTTPAQSDIHTAYNPSKMTGARYLRLNWTPVTNHNVR